METWLLEIPCGLHSHQPLGDQQPLIMLLGQGCEVQGLLDTACLLSPEAVGSCGDPDNVLVSDVKTQLICCHLHPRMKTNDAFEGIQ